MSIEHDVHSDMADILIVDDESANLKLLSDILGKAGFHVRPANSPKLAIDSALETPPDLILLDVRMPDMDGFEVCEVLKREERTRDIPVLFISGLHDTENKVRGFEAGAVDFITKPIEEEEVFARVRTHLQLRTMQRNLEKLVAERTAELNKSEELARTMFNATAEMTHLIEEDGTILDLNDSMAAWLGGTREELLGICVYDLFPQEAAEARRTVVRQACIERKPIRFEDKHSSGYVFDVGIYPIETPSGETDRVVVFVHDITEREEYSRKLQEREAALQQKVEQMRTIIDTTPAYIFAKDIDGRFLLANRAVADVFGVDDPEKVFGKTDYDYGATEEQTRTYRLLDRKIVANQQSLEIPEEQRLRKDGTLGWFQTTKVPYQHPGYDKPAVLGVAVEITERKEAEQAFKESESRFRATFEQAAVGIAHVAPDGQFLRINSTFSKILGYDKVELLKKSFQDITHPDDLEEDVKHVEYLLRGDRQTYSLEKRYIREDGTSVWCNLTVSSVREEHGPVKWFVAVIQDISERKRAEIELQRSRDYLENLINSIPDAVFSVKLPERTLEWARDSFNVLEYDLADYIGKTTEWLYPDIEAYQTIGSLIKSAAREKRDSFNTELTMLNAKGEQLPVEISASIFRDQGDPVSAIGLIRDISKRKQTETALKRNEARLSKAQEIAHLGSWSYDFKKRWLTCSDEMYQIYGLKIGTPVSFSATLDLVHPDDRDYCGQIVADMLDGKEVPSFGYRIMRPDGELRYIYVTAVVECDGEGNPSSIEGTLQDVTEMKTVEMAYRDSEVRLKQAQAEAVNLRLEMAHLNRLMTVNEFAASFAHELNQPLGAIANNATVARTLIERSGKEIEDMNEILADIADDAQRAGTIIRKIRGVMKKGTIEFRSLDINLLLDEVIGLYHNTFSLNHINVLVEKAPGKAFINADHVRLQQVLMNLITNGIDAMSNSSQKTFTFRTAQHEDRVCVSISDTGSGLEQSYIEHIFDPFYTTKSDGMGIGLRLCRSIIEEHGGRIWAENNRDGGATFSFTLITLPGDLEK